MDSQGLRPVDVHASELAKKLIALCDEETKGLDRSYLEDVSIGATAMAMLYLVDRMLRRVRGTEAPAAEVAEVCSRGPWSASLKWVRANLRMPKT